MNSSPNIFLFISGLEGLHAARISYTLIAWSDYEPKLWVHMHRFRLPNIGGCLLPRLFHVVEVLYKVALANISIRRPHLGSYPYLGHHSFHVRLNILQR